MVCAIALTYTCLPALSAASVTIFVEIGGRGDHRLDRRIRQQRGGVLYFCALGPLLPPATPCRCRKITTGAFGSRANCKHHALGPGRSLRTSPEAPRASPCSSIGLGNRQRAVHRVLRFGTVIGTLPARPSMRPGNRILQSRDGNFPGGIRRCMAAVNADGTGGYFRA